MVVIVVVVFVFVVVFVAVAVAAIVEPVFALCLLPHDKADCLLTDFAGSIAPAASPLSLLLLLGELFSPLLLLLAVSPPTTTTNLSPALQFCRSPLLLLLLTRLLALTPPEPLLLS